MTVIQEHINADGLRSAETNILANEWLQMLSDESSAKDKSRSCYASIVNQSIKASVTSWQRNMEAK